MIKNLIKEYVIKHIVCVQKRNGKVTWETNPFVYVYEFKLIKK